MRNTPRTQGFTLVEVMVAMAILTLAVTSLLVFRTGAMIDAAEARNWRVAREIAAEIFSELQAGARETPPDYMDTSRHELNDYPKFSYSIILGEDQIAALEGEMDGQLEGEEGFGHSDRRQWQQERDDLRAARQSGVSFYEYREKQLVEDQERLERADEPPSEDELEDVAVFVFFPNIRGDEGGDYSHFALKGRISTLAIQGLTPEEAEAVAESRSESSNQDPNSLTGGTPR